MTRATAPIDVAVGVVIRRDGAVLLPASAARIEVWRAAGHDVSTQVVQGPAFWQTLEIEDAPALLAASLAAMHIQVTQ